MTVKKPTWGIKPIKTPKSPFAVKSVPAAPAPRRFDFEKTVEEAIDTRRLLSLRYDDDIVVRTFQPAALYHSSSDKVCVTGVLIGNPADPSENGAPRVFEVGKMRSVEVTETAFTRPASIDRYDKRYAKGIIKSV